jgi:hypothetical protein
MIKFRENGVHVLSAVEEIHAFSLLCTFLSKTSQDMGKTLIQLTCKFTLKVS